jgi:phage protein D
MALSDNGKDVLNNLINLLREKLADWLVLIAAIAAGTGVIATQQSNQHKERIEVEKQAIHENNERLDKVAAEVKATARPLVFGGKE